MDTLTKTKSASKEINHDAIDGLSLMLADTYVLYLKTQNFHWNVTGPHFSALHAMFEEQYKQLAEAVDVIAERIRALRAPAPASFTQFLKLASLEEADNNLNADQMVKELLSDHEAIAKSISKLFSVMQECGDEVTLDLLIERKNEHDKTAWMLRSTAGIN
jgi:starvation-inducible DNA-binding protein